MSQPPLLFVEGTTGKGDTLDATGHGMCWPPAQRILKGFFFAGVAAALVCAAVFFLTEPNYQVTVDTSMVFSLIIALLTGIVGAALALLYHLSYLDALHYAARHYSETRTQREPTQTWLRCMLVMRRQ
jgi:hypothetical protein